MRTSFPSASRAKAGDIGESEELAVRLRNALARASRRLRQEANPGLPLSLVSALGVLDQHGPMTPSELADQERLARPGVTRMIARLSDEGLVTQQADPSDGRSYTVRITSRGRALLVRSRRRRTRFLSLALRRLDEHELAVLTEAVALLEQIVDDRP